MQLIEGNGFGVHWKYVSELDTYIKTKKFYPDNLYIPPPPKFKFVVKIDENTINISMDEFDEIKDILISKMPGPF